jgi:hypothetical protein
MLLNYILTLGFNFINWVLNLMPDVSIPDKITSAVTTASHYLTALNVFLPIDTLLAIIIIFLIIEGIILLIKIINWFIRKIPTIS